MTSLLVDDGRIIPVEPGQHLAGLVGDRWVCVRPTHDGEACSVELAALTCADLRTSERNSRL